MQIKRTSISSDIEKRILVGAIIDDDFCRQAIIMTKQQYFKIDMSVIVWKWICAYHKKYKKAPGREIQNIFDVESSGLKPAEGELVSSFLQGLSSIHEQSGAINKDLLLDQAREYFRERALNVMAQNILGKLALGRVDDAETEIRSFNKITKDISQWFNPFDSANINQVFLDDEKNKIFSFPGAVGKISGQMERDWLVAFMAPMKRGKSWWLLETAVHALMSGKRVAYLSLEMNKVVVAKRLYKRISALGSRPGDFKYPVFDCERNQDGTCQKEERVCAIAIKAPGTETPEFKKVKGYRPCQACRVKENAGYEVATWWGSHRQEVDFDPKHVARKVKHFKMLYGDNLQIIAYPAFSASFDDMENDLETLESQEGFIPDVIICDYFDISNPGHGSSGLSERGVADHVWKRGKAMAARRHCLVVTVMQSNRKSISKKSLEQEDTGEDIRKIAHVDMALSINQTPQEKRQGVWRIGVIAHRHDDFDFVGEAMVLQSLALGQPLLDDEFTGDKNEIKKK